MRAGALYVRGCAFEAGPECGIRRATRPHCARTPRGAGRARRSPNRIQGSEDLKGGGWAGPWELERELSRVGTCASLAGTAQTVLRHAWSTSAPRAQVTRGAGAARERGRWFVRVLWLEVS